MDDTSLVTSACTAIQRQLYDYRSALFPPVSSVINWRFLLIDFPVFEALEPAVLMIGLVCSCRPQSVVSEPGSVFSPAGSPTFVLFLFVFFSATRITSICYHFSQISGTKVQNKIYFDKSLESLFVGVLSRIRRTQDKKKNNESVFNSGQNKE